MFQIVPLSIIRSFSLYTQQWHMSYSLLTAVSKPVEFYSKNKFEKLVHLHVIGFTIRIYHDSRSPERQTKNMYFWYQDIPIVHFLCVVKRNIRAPRPNILF